MGTDQTQTASQQILDEAANALKIAKINLMMHKATCFYTSILFSLTQRITEEVPTAATDGRYLLINPGFFVGMPSNHRLFILCHEVLHVALDHMHRMGNRTVVVQSLSGQVMTLWNIAGDYVINGGLVAAGYQMPDGLLYDIRFSNMTTEQVYDILLKELPERKQRLLVAVDKNGMNGGDVSYASDAEDDNAVPQSEVTEIILRATTQAKSMGQAGSIPGAVEMGLQRVLNPPLPWYIILRNYLTDIAKNDYSWRRPNRRFLPKHYMPIAHSEAIPNIAIFVDCSGSVSDHDFNVFITQIDDIKETMQPKLITVIGFDTQLKKTQKLTEGDNPFKNLTFTGRGGTRISPVHDWIAEHQPTLALIFTDGCFTQVPPTNRRIPVIYLVNNNQGWKSTQGGCVIHYDITKE